MIFSSPREEVFKIDKKFNNLLVLYMPLFGCAEMQDCRSKVAVFSNLKAEDVEEGFAVVGGIARVVLQGQARGHNLQGWIAGVIGKLTGYTEDGLKV